MSIVFTQPEDAVVKISGIRDLKEYLLRVRPVADGRDVIKYDVASELGEHTLIVRQLLSGKRAGRDRWRFYGYLDDVISNISKGLLEPKE